MSADQIRDQRYKPRPAVAEQTAGYGGNSAIGQAGHTSSGGPGDASSDAPAAQASSPACPPPKAPYRGACVTSCMATAKGEVFKRGELGCNRPALEWDQPRPLAPAVQGFAPKSVSECQCGAESCWQSEASDSSCTARLCQPRLHASGVLQLQCLKTIERLDDSQNPSLPSCDRQLGTWG